MIGRRKHILFEKVGFSYMPANPTGWLLLFIYLAFVTPLLVVPAVIWPHSGIVSTYQVVTFLLFWWFGMRFAGRHSA